ncbi:MAG: PAS domain S-box protein [Telluria sp.]
MSFNITLTTHWMRWWAALVAFAIGLGAGALWLVVKEEAHHRAFQVSTQADARLLEITAQLGRVRALRRQYAAQPAPALLDRACATMREALGAAAAFRELRSGAIAASLLRKLDLGLQPAWCEVPGAGANADAPARFMGAGPALQATSATVHQVQAAELAARVRLGANDRALASYGNAGLAWLGAGLVLFAWAAWRLLRASMRSTSALALAQHRYRALFEHAVNGMAIVAPGGRIVEANGSYARMLGYAPEELAGSDFISLKWPAEREQARKLLEEVCAGKFDTVSSERRYQHRDGGLVWVRSSVCVLEHDRSGSFMLVITEDITASKLREQRLRMSETLVRNASIMAGIGGWSLDLAGLRIDLSECAAGSFGLKTRSMPLAALAPIFPRKDRRVLVQALVRCRRRQETVDVAQVAFAPGGERRNVRLLAQPVMDGAICMAIEGAVHDVTDIKRTEAALRQGELRFREIAGVTNDALWEWDAAGGASWRSDDVLQRLQLARLPSGPHDAFWFDLIHPAEREDVRGRFHAALADGMSRWFSEYRYRRADGSYGYIADRATIVRDEQGTVIRVVGGMLDVTDRRRVENAITKMAAAVPSASPGQFYDMLIRNLVRALDADAGAIARVAEDDSAFAESIAAIADESPVGNFRYLIAGSPCARLLEQAKCTVPDKLPESYPGAGRIGDVQAQAYVGTRLTDSRGATLGFIFVLYRQPLVPSEFFDNTLQVFAARATAEIERVDAHLHLREQAGLLNHAQDAVAVLDLHLRVRYWNPGAERIYGLSAAEARGRPVHGSYVDPDALAVAREGVLDSGTWAAEFTQLRADGQSFIAEERWSLVRNDAGEPYSILRFGVDVTERRAKEEQIRHLAYYDNLTGLPNRRLLLDRLSQARARAARNQRYSALLFLDMDNFKGINDLHGHHVGDEFLRQTAERLSSCVREADTVARLGGDEFVILLENLGPGPNEARAQARAVADQLITLLGAPLQLCGVRWRSTASIGVALFLGVEQSIEELLRDADAAMYEAKAAGRNGVRFAQPGAPQSASHAVLHGVTDQGGI